MNTTKLDTLTKNREILAADKYVAADFEDFIASLTEVIVAGQAPEAKLLELTPLLTVFDRAGMDVVAALGTAIASATIRARHS